MREQFKVCEKCKEILTPKQTVIVEIGTSGKFINMCRECRGK